MPAGIIHSSERSRRAAARSAAEEEAQLLIRHWRNIWRSLSDTGGIWSTRDGSEDLHWKLDKYEDPSRRCHPTQARFRDEQPNDVPVKFSPGQLVVCHSLSGSPRLRRRSWWRRRYGKEDMRRVCTVFSILKGSWRVQENEVAKELQVPNVSSAFERRPNPARGAAAP